MGNPMTDRIAALIEKMLEENGAELEIQRNKLGRARRLRAEPNQLCHHLTLRQQPRLYGGKPARRRWLCQDYQGQF